MVHTDDVNFVAVTQDIIQTTNSIDDTTTFLSDNYEAFGFIIALLISVGIMCAGALIILYFLKNAIKT